MVKEGSWAHLHIVFSPRWWYFWCDQKVKPFKSLESGVTSTGWISVCSSVSDTLSFHRIWNMWASAWKTKTIVVWTISQMSDQNSFPHSSLEWICQLSFTHRGSQEVSPLATNQESVYIWHSVKFSGFNAYEHHITQQTGYFLPSPVVVSNLVVTELYATIFQ